MKTTFSTAKTGCIGTTILCWFNPMELRLIGCTVLILAICLSASAQSSMERRLDALAMVETGGNDWAVGRDGEVSRYQITAENWIRYSGLPISAATNPFTARAVVVKIMDSRLKGRVVSDFDWYMKYSRPSRKQPHTIERERARFYSNLCSKPISKPTTPKTYAN